MDRRNFVHLTGMGLASLFMSRGGETFYPLSPLLRFPDQVSVKTDSNWKSLNSKDQQKWNFRDVELNLHSERDFLSVKVQSPSLAIDCFKISWEYSLSPDSRILGDHWERTYGDLEFKPMGSTGKMPWYFIGRDDKETLCFGVKTGTHSIAYWEVENGRVHLFLNTQNGGMGVLLGDRILPAAEIISTRSRDGERGFETARRFCHSLCDKARKVKKPVYGINDWYFAYGNNSSDLILEHTRLLAPLATSYNKPFSVIDAGWAIKSPLHLDDCCWGDNFSQSNSKFGNMGKLADQIKAEGMRPGLWLRPLSASHEDSESQLLPRIQGRKDPKYPILDPSIEENLERIQDYMKIYQTWGYELIKHDYTSFDVFGRWGFEMKDDLTEPGWHLNDRSFTNAEILLKLYKTIREAWGDSYIIGCNTSGHLSAGIFELNRIGDDTSGNEWVRTRKMGVNTMGFRMIQHKNFFEVDGDCVGITPKVPWEKNKQWMQLLAQSSAPLFISAQPDAIGREQKEFIKKSFSEAAKPQALGEPLDWMENPFPSKWRLDGNMVNFD